MKKSGKTASATLGTIATTKARTKAKTASTKTKKATAKRATKSTAQPSKMTKPQKVQKPTNTPKKPTEARSQSVASIKPLTADLKKVNQGTSDYAAPGIGELVPNFVLPSTEGEFCLQDLRGKKVVLYFYPKDSTPGCTIEGKEFSDQIDQFHSKGVEVFGVSRDSLKSHQNFKLKQGFKFSLLSDEDEKACRIFDVIKEKNMYGKIVLGIERSTFLIGEDGKLLAEWRKVKAQGHASEVFSELEHKGH